MQKANIILRSFIRKRQSYRGIAAISLFSHVDHEVTITRQQLASSQHQIVQLLSSLATHNSDQHSGKNNSINSSLPTHIPNNNNVPTKYIDFTAASKIEGDESHIATIHLHPGETLRAESGSMIYMTENVVLDTKLSDMSSAFNRMITGQNLFLTDFRYDGPIGTTGTVCLGTAFPSKILRMTLPDHPNSNLICQKGAYLASNPNIQIEMEFTKSLTAGFFGGQGFILQKLSGDTDVLIKGGGTIVCQQLKDDETLRVTSGSIVCFESTVSYDVQMVSGITNAMFGGEGLFMTSLQGPGQVWLQSMPPDRMVAEIASRVPSGFGFGIPIPLGGGGGGSSGAGDSVGTAVGTDEVASGTAAAVASDAAIEADRAATVATSDIGSTTNIDSESQTALFGDAVTPQSSGTSSEPLSSQSTNSVSDQEPPFYDSSRFSTERNEPTLEDDFSFDDKFENSEINDGEIFDDSALSGDVGSDSTVPDAPSIFRQIWDFFSDDSNN